MPWPSCIIDLFLSIESIQGGLEMQLSEYNELKRSKAQKSISPIKILSHNSCSSTSEVVNFHFCVLCAGVEAHAT